MHAHKLNSAEFPFQYFHLVSVSVASRSLRTPRQSDAGVEVECKMVEEASENLPKEVDEKSAEKPSEAECLKDRVLAGKGTWLSSSCKKEVLKAKCHSTLVFVQTTGGELSRERERRRS